MATDLAQADNGSGVAIGEWFKDLVFWLVESGESPIGIFGDFTDWIRTSLVGDDTGPGFLVELDWYIWPLAFFAVSLAARRPHRGLRAAIALLGVRALGDGIWEEVPTTLSMILVGVTLGTVVSLPIAVASVVSPGLRRVIRRLGDTSQLLVLSAYSIPLVFLIGLGISASLWIIGLATVVPMARALGQAFDAAQERPRAALGALAAGINTSAILGVWLSAETALIGSGGLGRLLFRATNNLNLSLFFTSAVALLGIGVALDQLTKPTAQRDGAFLDRTHQAWNLDPSSETTTPIPATFLRTAAPTVLGAVVSLVALVLPWSTDRATITSHVRDNDIELPGASFNGISEFGGGGFGLAVGTLALGALVGVLLRAIHRSGPPADFTTVIGAAISVVSVSFLITAPSPFATGSNVSVGAIVALVGGGIILLGTIIQRGGGAWSDVASDSRLGYLSTILGLIVAGGLIAIGSVIGWVVDLDPPRADTPADIQAEIDRLTEEAGDDINKQIANAQAIQNLINSTEGGSGEPWRIGGLHTDGPHTAFAILGASGLAALMTVAAAFGVERARWIGMGFAFGSALAAAAWISTTAAVQNDPTLRSDGGSLLVAAGAAGLMAITRRAPRREPREAVEEVTAIPDEEPIAEPSTEPQSELIIETDDPAIQSRARSILQESSS